MLKDEDLHIKLDESIFEKARKNLEELVKRREECKRKGEHLRPEVQGTEYMPRQTVWMYCSHCREFYERPLNAEELKEMKEDLSEPMTI